MQSDCLIGDRSFIPTAPVIKLNMFMINRPLQPVVIYDGTCGICAGNLKWLYRLDTLRKFDAIPYQAKDLEQFFPNLKIEDCHNAMHLVFPDGRTYTGTDALRQIFLRMPLMFVAGLLMSIPPVPWILRRLYPLLARNRYRLGGRCELTLRENPAAPLGSPEKPVQTPARSALDETRLFHPETRL